MPSDDAIAICEASAQPATADAAAAPQTAAAFSRVDGLVGSSPRDLRASRRVDVDIVSIVATAVVAVAHCRCGLCSYPPKASTAPSKHSTARAKRKPITIMIACVCNTRTTGTERFDSAEETPQERGLMGPSVVYKLGQSRSQQARQFQGRAGADSQPKDVNDEFALLTIGDLKDRETS
jgi:hypothetical protein